MRGKNRVFANNVILNLSLTSPCPSPTSGYHLEINGAQSRCVLSTLRDCTQGLAGATPSCTQQLPLGRQEKPLEEEWATRRGRQGPFCWLSMMLFLKETRGYLHICSSKTLQASSLEW